MKKIKLRFHIREILQAFALNFIDLFTEWKNFKPNEMDWTLSNSDFENLFIISKAIL